MSWEKILRVLFQAELKVIRDTISAVREMQRSNEEALQQLRDEVQFLQTEPPPLKQQQNKKFHGHHPDLSYELFPLAAFTARLSSQLQLEENATVRYDSVVSNAGGRYYPNGMFLCPDVGTHFFTWTVHSMRDQRAVVKLRKGPEDLAVGPLTLATDGKSSGTFQLSALVHCAMDDALWIRAGIVGSSQDTCDLEGEFNTFTGLHLY